MTCKTAINNNMNKQSEEYRQLVLSIVTGERLVELIEKLLENGTYGVNKKRYRAKVFRSDRDKTSEDGAELESFRINIEVDLNEEVQHNDDRPIDCLEDKEQ